MVLLYCCTFYTGMHRICCCCCCFFFPLLKQFYSSSKSLIHASHTLAWRGREGRKKKAEIKQKIGCGRGESKWKEGEWKKRIEGENKANNYANRRNQSQEAKGQAERESPVFGGAHPTSARPWAGGPGWVRLIWGYFQQSSVTEVLLHAQKAWW